MIRLNCFFQAKEGRYDKAIAAAKALVGESLTHPGCVAYDVFESATRPGIFMFCETWKDEASLSYHSSTGAFKKYVGIIGECGEMKVSEIGSKLMLDNGTLSPLLKKLEKEGYITRSRSSEDERIVMISLTQKGVEFYNGLSDIPGKIGSCVCLDSKKAGELYTLLYELLGSMQENQ